MAAIQPRAFILAGGDGTRLAPLAAKQFLALTGPRALVQQTFDRLSRYAPVTAIAHRNDAGALAAQLPGADVMLEEARRGTAAAARLAAEAHAGLLLLAPSDHVIADEAAFHRAVAAALPLAEEGRIVLFAVAPDGPETGYGYITPGIGSAVARFVEKPDTGAARDLIADGALWNSGIFLFRGDVLLKEMARLGVREGSLDRAVMEKTDRAAVVPCDMGWRDIGSWPSLWRHTQARTDLSPVVRPWGRYTGFAQGPGFQLKEIVVDAHARISLQRHSRRREHWIVMAGRARVTCDDRVFDLDVGATADIPLGALHRLENPGTEPLHILEVQFGDYLGEDDIERFADDYGRA
ncbi:MAG TPA: sugar phosphate nucleotidyltransferase [Rhizomicrobium sp.]|nr:sugar phosphate nucleotidyltransferase [Rhizomicrobium sp.]